MHCLRVAHVGYLEKMADRARWLAVREWLKQHDTALFDQLTAQERSGELVQEFIDLNGTPPRDFLAEEGRYSIVVTHHIWGLANAQPITTGGAAQSPRHSAENWIERINQAGPQYVFLAGNSFDLGAVVRGYSYVGFDARFYMSVLKAAA